MTQRDDFNDRQFCRIYTRNFLGQRTALADETGTPLEFAADWQLGRQALERLEQDVPRAAYCAGRMEGYYR